MKLRDKVILTTFGLFMLEAIMHYNMGKKIGLEDCSDNTKKKKGFLPPPKTFIKLGVIVAIFSVVNGLVIKQVRNN